MIKLTHWILCILWLGPVFSWAAPNTQETNSSAALRDRKWASFRPYAPTKEIYGLELGAMWEENNMYWLGGTIGYHMGRCMFAQSQTCQQFVDFTGGAGGRDGLTTGLIIGSLRWQFVNFPATVGPFFRTFAGVMNVQDDDRDRFVGTYGVGYGTTIAVHERFDIKIEARAGMADEFWSMVFFGANLKVDRLIEYFGNKIKEFGEGTIETGGRAIKKGIQAPGELMDVIDKNVIEPTFKDKKDSKE